MKTIRILGDRAARLHAFWWLAIVAAAPIAWVAAGAGFRLPVRSPALDLLVIALWSIGEEIVFRGALQPWFAARLGAARGPLGGPISGANLITSIVFAAFHAIRDPLAAAAVFPVSLVFGAAKERSGRLWPAVALHLYYNGLLYGASALHAG